MRIKRARKIIFILFTAFVALITAGWIYEKYARSSALSDFPPPGELVSVGTHKLHLDCRGSSENGSPIIVLEAGLDPLGSITWTKLHERMASITRTCAYDRAGFAWSETGPSPRSSESIAYELKELLSQAGEKGPYVIVAHSMGGPYSLVFVKEHPDMVAGLVLVESSHPDQFKRLPAVVNRKPPPKFITSVMPFLRKIGVMRHVMKSQLNYSDLLSSDEQKVLYGIAAGSMTTVLSEFSSIQLSLEEAGAVNSLGDLPLTVLASSDPPDASKMPDFDQDLIDEIHGIWFGMQKELAELSSEGKLIPVSNTSHYLHFDDPDIVVTAVSDLLGMLEENNN